ncbi:phytanoyl-CoA dioxygenase family protein [Primorskyibacter sp. S187A]|uniref:phytanoyl-CoA dioxygenase family protein n=1 Tax=Primorskyibacter sp. S187A TaxID=3415130 RepID=UPI003C797B7D
MATSKRTGYFSEETVDLEAFRALVEHRCTAQDAPMAADILGNVPIYDVAQLDLTDPDMRTRVLAEWAQILLDGAGVFALRGAYADTAPIDAATAVFMDIIQNETAAGGGADHFAAAGSNARIWNVVEKLCHAAPDVFARYFGNSAIAAACEAWLGPGYQMTAQVNLVRPGGGAQTCHRDYHLGFMTSEQAARYPAHVHRLSPVLTLQGAIAHCDMPVESGPTKLLPFSQRYDAGYMAYRRPEFSEYFEEHYVQVPLMKGDALFFNPALFHAAGANTSKDIERLANLVQVSSPMGIAMESMDRHAMCKRLYGPLREAAQDMPPLDVEAAIAACADGYAFPTSLDRDPPVGGLAPETQADIMRRAIAENWEQGQFKAALRDRALRRYGD